MMIVRAFVVWVALLAPFALRAQTSLPDPRVSTCAVARHAIARAATLMSADITIAQSPGCHANAMPADSLVGRITRRVIRAGEPLREPAIAVPPLVRAGQDIELTVREQGLALTMHATATGSATLGERVWVRLGAKRRLQGVVTAPGRVNVID